MKTPSASYRRHRYPPQIIAHAVWLYHRFSLSFRDVEDLLAQRGVEVSYETIRRWCLKFGPGYAARTKKRQPQLGDIWYLDEVFIKIAGRPSRTIHPGMRTTELKSRINRLDQ
jgi:putative transposase